METSDLVLLGAVGIVGYFAYHAYQNSQSVASTTAPIVVTIPNPVNNTVATVPVSSSAPVATSNGTVTPIVQPPAVVPIASLPVASNAVTASVVTLPSVLTAPAPTQFVNGIQQGYAPVITFTKSGNQWNGQVTNAPPNATINMPSNGLSVAIGSTDGNGNANFSTTLQPGAYWTVGPLVAQVKFTN